MTTHIDLEATSDRLLNEVERQRKYLARPAVTLGARRHGVSDSTDILLGPGRP